MKTIHRVILGLTVLGAMGVSGCTTTPVPIIDFQPSLEASNHLWQSRKRRLEMLDRWRLKGKIAVKAGKKGGQASLRWQYVPNHQTINLAGPLGGGRVAMEVMPGWATLKDTKGDIKTGHDANALLQEKLGWPLPFDALDQWVRGLPASDSYQVKLDAQGRIVSMNDGGWQVNYPEYQSVRIWSDSAITEAIPKQIEINALPGRISVYSDTGEYLGDELFVRVVLNDWQPE